MEGKPIKKARPRVEHEWKELSHEERTRHDILFYNQGPVDGFLPGDHARTLFLRSKLPLHVLSQIWNLADQPQDNVLDTTEFSVAMHLIQQTIRGIPVPKESLPPCLKSGPARPATRVPNMSKRELFAYRKLFQVLDQSRKGHIKARDMRDLLNTSNLPRANLAQIWDLSDINRDGQLNIDEFCIACHLTRCVKKDRLQIKGSINGLSILPNTMLKNDLVAKKTRMADLELRKKELLKLNATKKADAKKRSEKATIWRERLEILKRRHQALREDPAGVSDVILGRHSSIVSRAEEIVATTDSVSKRLDKEQQSIRKETATVIMDAEKLAQEVNKLQEQVDRLKENRRRTSQLKDLDPFHQLFEDQKEESLTGIHTKKKKVPTATLR